MRTVTSLDGIWRFVVDQNPKYHLDPVTCPLPFNARTDVCRRHWKDVIVPGCWQKYEERLDIYEGVCWYHRAFMLDALQPGETAAVRFGAVNYACRVFVNGAEIGGHETGYTPFALDCTEVLREGENQISVCVDNRDAVTVWPHVVGYFNYGGLHRSVTLIRTGMGDMEDVRWDTAWQDGVGMLSVSGKVRGGKSRLKLSCGGAETEISADENGEFAASLSVQGAKPWSPETPVLYDARLVAESGDTRENRCGFKSVCVENGEVFLNGAPYRLHGVCHLSDNPDSGMTMTQENILRDLRLMKGCGVNAIRCHYPMDEKFYDACDEMGFLVWIEPNIYCYHPRTEDRNTLFADEKAKRLALQMVEELVIPARDHVCVSIYGIGNECNTANPEAPAFFRAIADTLRRDGGNRLISYAALYGTVDGVFDLVDIVGINSYWGWYDKLDMAPDQDGWKAEAVQGDREPIDLTPFHGMMRDVLKKIGGKKALLLTEFGADAVPGYFSRSREMWSEEYQADLIEEIITTAKQYPQIMGTFVFAFEDYRDPSKDFNGYWNEWNLKGLVDYGRRPKKSYEAVKRCYQK